MEITLNLQTGVYSQSWEETLLEDGKEIANACIHTFLFKGDHFKKMMILQAFRLELKHRDKRDTLKIIK